MTLFRRALMLSLALLPLSGCVVTGPQYQDDYRDSYYRDGDYYAPGDETYGDYYYAPPTVEYRYIETYPSYGFWRLDRYGCGYYGGCWPYSYGGWPWPSSGWSLFVGHGWSYGGWGSAWGWGGHQGYWPHSRDQYRQPRHHQPSDPPRPDPGYRDRGENRYPPPDWRERERLRRPSPQPAPILEGDAAPFRPLPRQIGPGDEKYRPRRPEPRISGYESAGSEPAAESESESESESEGRWRAPARVMPAPATAPGAMRYPRREPLRQAEREVERYAPRPEPRDEMPSRPEPRWQPPSPPEPGEQPSFREERREAPAFREEPRTERDTAEDDER